MTDVALLVALLPIVTLIIGWFLKGYDQSTGTRRDRKRILNLALFDLLEVRHRLMSTLESLDVFETRLPQVDEARAAVLDHLKIIADSMSLVKGKYAEAVTLIGGFDPLLAFSLRSMGEIPETVQNMATGAEAAGIDTELAIATVKDFVGFSVQQVDAGIQLLARRRGLTTWFKMKKHLSQDRDLAPQLDRFLKRFGKHSQSNAPTSD